MNANAKFTPGPYSVSGIPGDNHIMARKGHSRVTVAIVTGWQGISPDELEANKALIAAAPALLAALEAGLSADFDCVDGSGSPKVQEAIREQARQAIRKASGE